ncbi:LPXTG cell wall anchor domain-containing protein [Arundinibacter roseus]|uniref:LPXTG cell wall anchor domain-containing protein n=1 Tax=Arundinibacter roseus TaxID=2070510 RepID=A0A4R4K9S3_9BACT|nr:LPXTG cell wall anchor domain-containing protein [Arundinibacter roseus]TDB63392.1 LPXTG cell wall anchor domain-containing protein [Arundinibacter roseus]
MKKYTPLILVLALNFFFLFLFIKNNGLQKLSDNWPMTLFGGLTAVALALYYYRKKKVS